MSSTYVKEKLYKVIYELTTGQDDIVERLRKAGSPYLMILPEDSFPESARALWIEVSERFREDMQQHNLTVEEAIDLLNKLLEIQNQVRQHSGK